MVVYSVTQLHDVVYVVGWPSSTIHRFNATTHARLTDINVKDMTAPCDIAACTQTSQLYVPDLSAACIWRVSSDGEDIKRWWTQSESDTFTPCTLSVTSSRLLVTSCDTGELLQLDVSGDEVRRVRLPDYMDLARHAVESVTGTFIVSHLNTQLNDQCQVSEVNNTTGDVLRQFSPSSLGVPSHIASDSQGNIIVADSGNRRILLLDDQLALRRVIIDERQLNYERQPWRLCYMQHTGQLLVALADSNVVMVFDVLE